MGGSELKVGEKLQALSSKGWKLGKLIGTGAFSNVYVAEKDQEPQVALKVLRDGCTLLNDREIAILRELNHPHLIRYLGALEAPINGVILELCMGGSLWQFLHHDQGHIARQFSLWQRVRA